MNLYAIITGNLIATTKKTDSVAGAEQLKNILLSFGMRPFYWEIFLGTSFQIVVEEPEKALEKAILIKAAIKCVRGMDVRISIGIGSLDLRASKATECIGEAFQKSLYQFDYLGVNNLRLGLNTPWAIMNEYFNASLPLLENICDKWKPATAQIIMNYIAGNYPRQKEMASQLGLSQAMISTSLTRGGWSEIATYLDWTREKLQAQLQLESMTTS
ncbi:MAG: transcriptional regulator [Flavobacteriales bacterium]